MRAPRSLTLIALLLLAAVIGLAGCGSTKHAGRTGQRTSTTRSNGQSKAGIAALSSGSGVVTGPTAHASTSASAALPAGTPAVDAVYGPPADAVVSEDVPQGDSASSLSKNGTPAASGVSARSRTAAAVNDIIPTDQNFTAEWFSATSPWNTNIASLPIDPASTKMLRLAQYREAVTTGANGRIRMRPVRDNSGVFINTVAWTDPVVTGGRLTPVHCRQTPNCGDDPSNRIKELEIPTNVNPLPYYDGWFTVISPDGRSAYDMWRARRLSDGSISFQYMRIWDLQGSGYGQTNTPSARGSGLPLFAGLIRPEELKAGTIDHALAISVPGPAQKYYVQPASTTDGNGATNSLPEGARLRLRANVTIPPNSRSFQLTIGQRQEASALLYTLRNYGAIVVDRSAVPTLYAQQGVTAPLLVGNELQFLKLSDFQVIQLPPKLQFPADKATSSSTLFQVSSVSAGGGGGY